jgi:hypothetical protein
MKKLLVLIIILGVFVNLNAQERTNELLPTEFISKSPKLTSAIGWKKNEITGKWVDNTNLIFDKKINTTHNSTNNQNFKSIQFSKIKYNNNKYYVFLHKNLKGLENYRGESLFGKAKLTHFFVMTEEQYIELKTKVESKSGENIIIKSKIWGGMTDLHESLGAQYLYTEENLVLKIIAAIKSPTFYAQQMIVNSQFSGGKEVARFLLPNSTSGDFLNWRNDNNKRMRIEYFEVNLSEFKTILIE